MRPALVLLALLLLGCVDTGSPTEPTAHQSGPAAPTPTPVPTPCPPGSTYYVPTRSCVSPALCPPGYYFEAYVGCQWPTTGAGPEPTPKP